VYCPSCGVNNQDEVKFCTRCGTNLDVVSEALGGKSTGSLETNERMVRLLKDYYRSRRMTIIGGVASFISLFKLALLLVLGFPEKMLPLAALLTGLLLYGLFALIWGMTKWNNSSSEIKALGFSPPKGKKLAPAPNQLRLGADRSSISAPAYTTDPIKIPGSVTEQTTHLLDEPMSRPPIQNQ
jgi:zinc ribbon protein